MMKITLKISGMMCGMCEAHINDAIRKQFNIAKVTMSHSKGTAVILCEEDIDASVMERVICDTGYDCISIQKEPDMKKEFFLWH